MNVIVVIAAFYLAKVVLVSALLFGYYRLFLRDRLFHQYNRYYLLGATVASVILPLIHLPVPDVLPVIGHAPAPGLYSIVSGEWKEAEATTTAAVASHQEWSAGLLLISIYAIAVLLLLGAFIRQLLHIRRLPGKYPRERLGRIDLFMTREPGTPFSFLNRLFWNEEIDIDSARGRQILQHEWYHIRQRHTLDLLWLKALLTIFWVNPFFYLIYREIRTIHEFLADRYAVADGDRYEYAELLVWHSVYDRPLSILHPFFQSSIKRRITMLTQFHSTRPGYWRRMMILPLTFLLLCAFAGKRHAARSLPRMPLFTVVIDAGHGGSDNGAVAGGVKEKDINLALALKVKQLSPEYHINVVLTRRTDELAGGKNDIRASLEYRAEMARDSKADLFVSLHVNNDGGVNPGSGFGAYISPENTHFAECQKLGTALLDALKTSYTADSTLHQPTQGVYLLRHTTMPAVLLECGFIDNPKDLAFIRDSQNQEKVARDILQGIRRYRQAQPDAK
ncbi:MAG TPA: N-acetylmuramoyl-L-alanine amidase [Puia sp.]|jgi:N-acetylmuramoyl-L-alanine amidase|nr:N-acetylmuramoyl-L-alanine amidase [Puia sp.]